MVRFPTGNRAFNSAANTEICWVAILPSCTTDMEGFFSRKLQNREADHFPSSNAEFKNEWSHTSSPLYFGLSSYLTKHYQSFRVPASVLYNDIYLQYIKNELPISNNQRYFCLEKEMLLFSSQNNHVLSPTLTASKQVSCFAINLHNVYTNYVYLWKKKSSISATEMSVQQSAEIMFLEKFSLSCFTYLVVTVLQDMIDGLTEIGRCYGNGNESGKQNPKEMRISKQSSPAHIMIDQKQLQKIE
jgi:hypothetical protein